MTCIAYPCKGGRGTKTYPAPQCKLPGTWVWAFIGISNLSDYLLHLPEHTYKEWNGQNVGSTLPPPT